MKIFLLKSWTEFSEKFKEKKKMWNDGKELHSVLKTIEMDMGMGMERWWNYHQKFSSRKYVF